MHQTDITSVTLKAQMTLVLRVLLCSLTAILFLFSYSLNGQTWNGSGPTYKTIKTVVQSPANPNIIYAGALGWGVFKSIDGGATWVNFKTGLLNTYVRSLLVLSDTVVYAGTNNGIYKTTNGGLTWIYVLVTPFSVRSLARDSHTGSLYGATYGSGLFKSTNQGISWSQLTVVDPNTFQTLTHLWCVVAYGSDSLYVGGSILDIPQGSGGALFQSGNGGTSWFQVQYPTAIRSSIRSIALSPTNPAHTFIVGTAAKGVYISTNAGVSFTNIDGIGTTTHPLPDQHITSVAFAGSTYYAGTDSLGGSYFRAISDVANGWTNGAGLAGAPAQVNSIAIDHTNSNTMYLGTEIQGVYKSTNGGTNWFASRSGMMGVAAATLKFNSNGKLFLGTDFGDGIWSSNDSGKTWTHIDSLATVDGVFSFGITNNPLIIYAGTSGAGVHKSTDGGLIWKVTDTTVINNFVRPVQVHPTNPNIVFAGTANGVYKTTNGGTTWFALNTGIPASAFVRTMDMVETNPNIILAGTDSSYLFRTTNGGASWTNITNANGFLPQDIHIRSVTIDQTTPSIAYVGADSGRMYKSTDGGQNWALIYAVPSGNSVRKILIHPTNVSTLFAVTFGQGVFVSIDAGSHWSSYSAGLPDSSEYTIETDKASPLGLVVGSHANGVFRNVYTNHPPVISPIGNKSIYANHLLTFAVTATDPDGSIPSMSVVGLPSGAGFTDNGNGTASFTWTPTGGQIGNFVVTFRASDGTLLDSQKVTIAVLDSSISALISVPIVDGWNMISVPVKVGDPRKAVLFPTAVSSAFSFSGSYLGRDTLLVGGGYWLKFSGNQTVDLGGQKIVLDTVPVNAGWNMLGSVSNPVPVLNVQPIPPMSLISSFFGYAGAYVVADTVKPGFSYWIKTSQSGKIILSAPSGNVTMQSRSNSSTATSRLQQSLSNVNMISFTDAQSNRSELHFLSAEGMMDESRFDLPPLPPEGSFDVRFASQRSAVVFHPKHGKWEVPVTMTGVRLPLSIRWNIVDNSFAYTLRMCSPTKSIVSVPLSKSGSFLVERVDGIQFSLQVASIENGAIPKHASLDQNFPNPFNPSTVITYVLPSSANVEIKIYDMIGREISTLVHEKQDAGTQSVPWNANRFATGMYIYRMRAEFDNGAVFQDAKKMFLIK